MLSKNIASYLPVIAASLGAVASIFIASSAHAEAHVGAGLIGIVGGNFLDKPDRTAGEPDIYPGYGGLTVGGGLMLDGRILKELLGLEVDIIRSSDKGKGTVTFNGVDFKQTVGQGAWHVPVLAKITIPSPLIAPQFFLGPEFVFPSSPTSSVEGPSTALGTVSFTTNATAGNYVMITGGLGVEIKLPLPIIDLRIPVGLRASFNPGVSSKFSDRVQLGAAGATYNTEWKYAVNFTAGAALYF